MLEKIWKKIKAGETASKVDKFVLWANGFGYYGLMWAFLAVVFFLADRAGMHHFFLIPTMFAFGLCTGVFIVKSWIPIRVILKGKLEKFLPEYMTKDI